MLGEFSRGKSTFVNALLGKALLPMDVLPETATINALVYGEKAEATVIRKDGTKEKIEADIAHLKQFSAQNTELDFADIQYLKIAYPATFLKQKIMLVDTPGVSDMDDQRAEITYGFIPQADVVIFLLDATAPLKKTEKEFIEKRLIPQGISNIIFVANKYDNLDEEEAEDNEILVRLERRLNTAFNVNSNESKLKKIELFPISSTMALKSIETGKSDLLESSGMKLFQARLQELVSMGEREEAKMERYRWKYDKLVMILSNKMISERSIVTVDQDSLVKVNDQLRDMLTVYQNQGDHISEYVEDSRKKIIAMTDKSLQYFHSRLEDDVVSMVEDYRGSDFKEFVESRVVKRVHKEIDNWQGIYGPRIDQLVQKMGSELTNGLSRHFNEKVQLDTINKSVVHGEGCGIQVEVDDLSYTDAQAGAIAATGGIVLTLIAGSTFMPFVSFAAMPLIRKKLLEQKLGAAKEALLPELQNQLIQCMVTFQESLHQKIDEQCNNVEKNVSYAYKQLLITYQDKVQAQIEFYNTDGSRLLQEISSIEEDLADLEGYIMGGIRNG